MKLKKCLKIIIIVIFIIIFIIICLKVSKNWRLTHYEVSDHIDISFGEDKMNLPLDSHTSVLWKSSAWSYGCLSYTSFPSLKDFYGTSLNYRNETGEYRQDYKIKEYTANKLVVQKDNYEIEINLIASDLNYIRYTIQICNYNKAKPTNELISTLPEWFDNLTENDVIDGEDIVMSYNRFRKNENEVANPFIIDGFKTDVPYNSIDFIYFPADDTTNPYDKYKIDKSIPVISFKVVNYDKTITYIYLKKIDDEWKVFDVH